MIDNVSSLSLKCLNEVRKSKPLNTEIYLIIKLLGMAAGIMLADL
jgi:hypothetical protein